MNCVGFSLFNISILCIVAWVHPIVAQTKTMQAAEADWREAIKPNFDACKFHMSEETASYFDDDEEYDNEEVRRFLVCLYTSLSYMEGNKMKAKPIHDDILTHFDGVTQQTVDAIHDAVDFCVAHEVEDDDSDVDAAGKFTNCLNKKKRNDVDE